MSEKWIACYEDESKFRKVLRDKMISFTKRDNEPFFRLTASYEMIRKLIDSMDSVMKSKLNAAIV